MWHVAQDPRAASGAGHTNRQLQAVWPAHMNCSGRGGSERGEREQVRGTDPDGIRPDISGSADHHSWKQVGQMNRRVDGTVNARGDVQRADAIVVVVDEHLKRHVSATAAESQCDSGRARDGERPCDRHARRQIPGRGPRPLSMQRREQLRHGNRRQHGQERQVEQKIDEREPAGPQEPGAPAAPPGSYCVAARSVRGAVMVTRLRSFRNAASPMPRAFISSSI